MKQISFVDVEITGGFWKNRQRINEETTIFTIYERFCDTGRFDAFACNWCEGGPNKPHCFWDSDVAKWIEAVAYLCERKRNPKLEQIVDGLVELIDQNQGNDGYFNSYFMSVEPARRFCDRTMHELYCAGHLIEAAVAYAHATGKERFLQLMCRYADYMERVFVKEKSAKFITPGHEELELALVRLYHATGENRYLELAKYFIDHRSEDPESTYYAFANSLYAQDDRPVRELDTATGHAVRAVYLYSAMADLAFESDDEELMAACRRVFDSIVNRRMYVTGGIGSTHHGEAFTIDYDLPNQTAYAETCAALGLVLFASRMSNIEADSIYADTAERALYNGMLSGVSLDGKAFFYENPLAIDPALRCRDSSMQSESLRLPATQRAEVFECSCCPPNIARFVASVGNILYSHTEDTIYVHHFMDSVTRFPFNGREITLTQKTDYPHRGRVEISVEGEFKGKIAVRVPGWCPRMETSATYSLSRGYAYFGLDTQKIIIEFDMPVVLIEAAPMVQNDSGRVAVTRGPLVYCLEAVDNGAYLRDIRIPSDAIFATEFHKGIGAHILKTEGVRRDAKKFRGLYRPYRDDVMVQPLVFIPYFAFANRGESEMLVWVGVKENRGL